MHQLKYHAAENMNGTFRVYFCSKKRLNATNEY